MLIKSEIKAEKNQTWPQCAEGTGGTCVASLWRGDPYPTASQFSSNTTLTRSSSKIPLLSSWVLHPGGPKGGEGKAHSYFSRWPALSTAGSCQPCHAAISWVNNPSSNSPVSYWVRRFPKPTTKTLLNSLVMITSGQGSLSLPSTTRLPNQGYYWLRRDQRRSEMALNRLEVGNKSPWHPIPTLCDAMG